MNLNQFLLSDEEVQKFLVDGFHLVQSDLPKSFHDELCERMDQIIPTEGNPGNNLLPRYPMMRDVFEEPKVRGALTSLLGEDYVMNPHRHVHLNHPGEGHPGWHKDCYVFDHQLRHQQFEWLLVLYFPQDTTVEMGATNIVSGAQLLRDWSHVDEACHENKMAVTGKAGTIALLNFDTWHTAVINKSDIRRYMLKFQFARISKPKKPSWNHQSIKWVYPRQTTTPSATMHTWSWLCGNANTNDAFIEEKVSNSDSFGNESQRLNAAYEWILTKPKEKDLQQALLIEAQSTEAMSDIEVTPMDDRHGTNSTATPVHQAIVALGEGAKVPLLNLLEHPLWWARATALDTLGRLQDQSRDILAPIQALTQHEHWWVRRNAIEAMGRLETQNESDHAAIAACLEDSDNRVRRNAALSLVKCHSRLESALPALKKMDKDPNRYNRHYALLAQQMVTQGNIHTEPFQTLIASRWCEISTPANRY